MYGPLNFIGIACGGRTHARKIDYIVIILYFKTI